MTAKGAISEGQVGTRDGFEGGQKKKKKKKERKKKKKERKKEKALKVSSPPHKHLNTVQ